ncbi:MAG: hypothetical protein A2557_13705 [Candidatus Lambdaproteobacteria bacterium RIFOXYD2_FULL_56_26]|uniref:Uncharacterized protein n=1 Tax=Candidatus Lambdaproteobacteria bacterium RIFOXYD2_FULL_56_26 TaxID=1817773 RepID=A0A1F6H0F5_9PROT|nr:MAG: hypothetical protein A2557_13705 [Candidatus Lambdaproteobacteria bacterium RIFOXYD2_FULL_56_26]
MIICFEHLLLRSGQRLNQLGASCQAFFKTDLNQKLAIASTTIFLVPEVFFAFPRFFSIKSAVSLY